MKRLTTDNPNGNFETILNFVYSKDGWAYIRHDGEFEDVSLTNWARRQCQLRGCKEVFLETPQEIDERLCDCLMDGPICSDVPSCPIALAYCFASQAVHLRSRLAAYEDTGMEPGEILKATATDMSPVVHGRWKEGTVRGSFALICSECGCDAGVNYNFAYCPNCGAKMDLPKESFERRKSNA